MCGLLYRLPEDLRHILAELHRYTDSLLIEGPREYTSTILRQLYFSLNGEIFVVGDFVCESFLLFVGVPKLCVVDFKSMRRRYGKTEEIIQLFDRVTSCTNPRSTVSQECIDVIRHSIALGLRTVIVVDGEEDLLALPLIAYSMKGAVVYGQPNQGVVVVEINEMNRKVILNIFSRFKREEITSELLY